MSYSSIYHSPWHNPGLLLLANGLLCGYLLVRKADAPGQRFLRNFLLILVVLAGVDAALTGELAPFPEAIVPYVAIPFVILGDVRFFFLMERYARPGGQTRSVAHLFGRSLLWGLLVPVLANAVRTVFFPDKMGLWVFLTYEAFFTGLMVILHFVILPRWLRVAEISEAQKRWVRGTSWCELTFYVLWATADIVILSGHEEGYLLRLVPNIMYYAVFGWFVALLAPKEIRP